MRRRGITLILFSLILGGAAAWLANNWLETRLLPAAEASDVEIVVAAAIAIPYGTKIDERHTKVIEIPKGTAPEGAIRSLEDISGKVAKQPMTRGEILLGPRFADHAAGSTLAALIEENKRAITLRVNDVVGVAGFLLPGNRIDVLATRKVGGRAVTETVLFDLKVLAVDQTTSTEKNEPVIVRAVTLEVTPQQSHTLVKARSEGSIQLTLRNPLDTYEEPEPVAEAPKPKPKKRYRPPQRSDTDVTIIRGTRTTKEKAKI